MMRRVTRGGGRPGTSLSAKKQRGFTLIELLVSMVIMALVSLGAYRFISSTSRTGEILQAKQQRLLSLERMQSTIASDLAQWVNRPIRDEMGDPLPPFILDQAGGLEFTRRGLSNPLDRSRSDMMRVRYEVRDGQLWRMTWYTLDRLPGQRPLMSPLGPRGVSISWFVQASPYTPVQNVWPSLTSGANAQGLGNTKTGAPEIVNLKINVPPWGDIRREFWLPGNDNGQDD